MRIGIKDRGSGIGVEVRIRVAGVVGFVAVLWWVFVVVCAVGFLFFWWLGVEVVVGDGDGGYGCE